MVDFMFVIALLIATLISADAVISGCVEKACSRSVYQIRVSRVCHNFYTIREHVLIGNAYRNKTARSYVSCAVFCLQDNACKSFNYGKDDKLCQLNSAVYSSSTILQPSQQSFYFDDVLHDDIHSSSPTKACRRNYTTVVEDGPEILSGQAEPIRLELRAQTQSSDSFVFVTFYQSDQSSGFTYVVELHSTDTNIYKKRGEEEFTNQSLERALIGSRVSITFTSALITLEVDGEEGILLSHVEQNPITATSWSVSIGGSVEITWEFYGVCNFN